jgi:hypothetical protein
MFWRNEKDKTEMLISAPNLHAIYQDYLAYLGYEKKHIQTIRKFTVIMKNSYGSTSRGNIIHFIF